MTTKIIDEIIEILKKYGAVGLVLGYFLVMDYDSRMLDRQDRKNNVLLMEQIAKQIQALDNRVAILEKQKKD